MAADPVRDLNAPDREWEWPIGKLRVDSKEADQ